MFLLASNVDANMQLALLCDQLPASAIFTDRYYRGFTYYYCYIYALILPLVQRYYWFLSVLLTVPLSCLLVLFNAAGSAAYEYYH